MYYIQGISFSWPTKTGRSGLISPIRAYDLYIKA